MTAIQRRPRSRQATPDDVPADWSDEELLRWGRNLVARAADETGDEWRAPNEVEEAHGELTAVVAGAEVTGVTEVSGVIDLREPAPAPAAALALSPAPGHAPPRSSGTRPLRVRRIKSR